MGGGDDRGIGVLNRLHRPRLDADGRRREQGRLVADEVVELLPDRLDAPMTRNQADMLRSLSIEAAGEIGRAHV